MTENRVQIRTASPSDAGELLAIYAPYVVNTPITFEYDIPTVQEFEDRMSAVLTQYPYLIAIQDGSILGYAYASAFKSRAAYSWCVETSIYVRMESQGRGLGHILYEELETILAKQHILNLNACIAYPNPASIAFHEKLGYQTIAHFSKCGYKLGHWYDMIWMEKLLGEHKESPEPFIPFSELN